MMCQVRFTDCDKGTSWGWGSQDVNSGGNWGGSRVQAGSIWDLSVLSAQFSWEPKTDLKSLLKMTTVFKHFIKSDKESPHCCTYQIVYNYKGISLVYEDTAEQ